MDDVQQVEQAPPPLPDQENNENALYAESKEEFIDDLECLYIKNNHSGRLNFTKKWPDIAQLLFCTGLQNYDQNGTNDKEHKATLEDDAEQRQNSILDALENLDKGLVVYGTLQIDVLQDILKKLPFPVAEKVFENSIVRKHYPDDPEPLLPEHQNYTASPVVNADTIEQNEPAPITEIPSSKAQTPPAQPPAQTAAPIEEPATPPSVTPPPPVAPQAMPAEKASDPVTEDTTPPVPSAPPVVPNAPPPSTPAQPPAQTPAPIEEPATPPSVTPPPPVAPPAVPVERSPNPVTEDTTPPVPSAPPVVPNAPPPSTPAQPPAQTVQTTMPPPPVAPPTMPPKPKLEDSTLAEPKMTNNPQIIGHQDHSLRAEHPLKKTVVYGSTAPTREDTARKDPYEWLENNGAKAPTLLKNHPDPNKVAQLKITSLFNSLAKPQQNV